MGYQFTQLTAVGNTEAITVKGNINHTFQVVVANKNTSVDYNVQGSLDGTNFFDLSSSDVQQTADGTYCEMEKSISSAIPTPKSIPPPGVLA